jgi:hypothetical protein
VSDPADTFVVKIGDLDKTPLVDTKGRPVPGRVKEIKPGNNVAIVIVEGVPNVQPA